MRIKAITNLFQQIFVDSSKASIHLYIYTFRLYIYFLSIEVITSDCLGTFIATKYPVKSACKPGLLAAAALVPRPSV